jgi:hypothetical protein
MNETSEKTTEEENRDENNPQTTIQVPLSDLREAWEAVWDNPRKYGMYEDLAKYVAWQDDNPAETVNVGTEETSMHTQGWTRVRIRELVDKSSIRSDWEYGCTWHEARYGTIEHGDESPENDDFEEVVRECMGMARDEAWHALTQNLKNELPRQQVRFEYVDE